ncbi:tctex1 domain-containing protein 1-A-like [Parambassis ranga]|uniref:Tctex1 domain-containing protein 1 n=1 Tax=Parambassis ranga TaxID=210632 RepID=A0A6P7K3N7_9TELE|nr:tctex1 domain-containing protein 1 [Parambassis ranga]XP_028283948.1 tctex1 domain-containing protein 1 [Parambassis ranga]
MSDAPEDKQQKKEKKMGKVLSEGSHGSKEKGTAGRTKDSISTVSCQDELGHQDDNTRMAVTMENTYQMGPYKHFPVSAVTDILKDVLTTNLQQEQYDADSAQKKSKTISEEIRARVKDLMIPRYRIVTLVHIGQLTGQSMQISSRYLWDASTDTFTSYSIKNSSLFGMATVYAVYLE